MSTAPTRSGGKAKSAARPAVTNLGGNRLIPLDLKSALGHLQVETGTVLYLEGLPEGMRLTAGAGDERNVWSLTIDDLDSLAVQTADDYRGQAPLSVSLVNHDPENGQPPRTVSSFGLLLTPDGAVSAFSGLEVDNREGNFASVVQLRNSVGKGRGKLKVKTAKRPIDFGDGEATAAFDAQRSKAHLDALFRGELAYNDGATSEASLQTEQRLSLARKLWEGESSQKIAEARKEWDSERTHLIVRINELEDKLQTATDEISQVRQEVAHSQSNVRSKLIDIVTRLSDEHAAELAEIEQRLKQEADEMLSAARAEWERAINDS